MKAAIFKSKNVITIEEIDKPTIKEQGDAIVRVVPACVCGSDLWYYRGISEHNEGTIGHKFIGVVEEVGPAPVKAYMDILLPAVLEGRINPGKVFDMATDLDHIQEAYEAVDERRAIKALLKVSELQ